jgi:hypothetical protein
MSGTPFAALRPDSSIASAQVLDAWSWNKLWIAG